MKWLGVFFHAFDLSQRLLIERGQDYSFKEFLFDRIKWEKTMIRLIAVAAFALGLATAVQAMPVASPVTPLNQPNGMYTQARVHHGVARRQVRRCAVWGAGHVCRKWY
jgi:hypothetical protein